MRFGSILSSTFREYSLYTADGRCYPNFAENRTHSEPWYSTLHLIDWHYKHGVHLSLKPSDIYISSNSFLHIQTFLLSNSKHLYILCVLPYSPTLLNALISLHWLQISQDMNRQLIFCAQIQHWGLDTAIIKQNTSLTDFVRMKHVTERALRANREHLDTVGFIPVWQKLWR